MNVHFNSANDNDNDSDIENLRLLSIDSGNFKPEPRI